jgi:hypothetical protein
VIADSNTRQLTFEQFNSVYPLFCAMNRTAAVDVAAFAAPAYG